MFGNVNFLRQSRGRLPTIPGIFAFCCAVLGICWGVSPAQAYIGPGAGIGVIGTLLGMVVAVVFLFVGFLWYPIRRFIRRRRTAHQVRASGADTDTE